LKFVALGGSSVSSVEKKRYHAFVEAHGGKNVTMLNGYGLSELGGACCLSSSDLDDESVGYPMPGISIKLYDEEKERFFAPRGKSSEGVLYLNAQSMLTLKLDGEDIVQYEIIDRKPYICTNDLVRVDGDGKITYLGRANRFFIRDEGRKYESGRVETEFSRLENIESCAIVPVYIKQYHDNFPMLCVKTLDGGTSPEEIIKNAFKQVFIEDKTLAEEDHPYRVMIVETFPLNANGKIDLFQLNRGLISGDVYNVELERKSGKLTGFNLTPCQDGPTDMIEMVFDDIKKDITNKLPTSKLMKKCKKENPTMENNKPFEYFDPMCYMQQQMMNNMSGMSQRFPMFNQFAPSFQTPEMQSMREMMPNMESMMPEMQKMAQTMYGMRPNVPLMVNNIAQAVLPILHQQVIQMFNNKNEIDQMAFEMAQRVTAQKTELDEKWYELALKMFDPNKAADAAEEEAEEAEEAEAEAEEAETEE
jgi:hypothetical protein